VRLEGAKILESDSFLQHVSATDATEHHLILVTKHYTVTFQCDNLPVRLTSYVILIVTDKQENARLAIPVPVYVK
jgi:hypothetical protein